MATSMVQVRVDDELKAKATAIYDELGMDLSTAIRLFLKRSIMVNGVPFSMLLPKNDIPNKAVSALFAASAEADMNGTADMTIDEINAEIAASRAER